MIFVGDDWAEDHHDIHIMNTDEITRKERFAKPVSSATRLAK